MEINRISAVFNLRAENFPERKRTTVIITDDGENVHVGAKAITRVYGLDEAGNVTIQEEQRGDIRTLRRDAPISCIFDSLKELFDEIPEIVDARPESVVKA